MLRVFAAFVVVSGSTLGVRAQDPEARPMSSAHDHRAQVDHRHDQVTGVDHQNAVHHFLLAKDGGSIRLEVEDAGEVDARDLIREHLQTVARSFAAGDFALPTRIHDQTPPGVEVMKKRKAAIRYSYEPSERGGLIRISTRNARALDAVHEFLRFQIRDHGTKDSLE